MNEIRTSSTLEDSVRRNVLMTGCASGIGRHLATAFAERGHWVMATDVDEAGLEEASEQMNWAVLGVQSDILDVSRIEDWRRVVGSLVDQRGRLDLVVHAAGFLEPGHVVEADAETIDRHVDVNLKGTMYGTRVAGEQMVGQEAGHIVNFGSLASLAPVPGLGLYSATKFGVRGFSLAAAQELADEGVDVTVVLPDAVDTPMLEKEAEFDEAAISFSAPELLEVEDFSELFFDRILPDRPLEVSVPPTRGAIARLVTLFPGAAHCLYPLFDRIGRDRQEAYREDRADSSE